MRSTHGAAVALACAAALAPAPGQASSTLTIEHATRACAVPEAPALVEALVAPAAEARWARVAFHAAGSPSWYVVEMDRRGGAWAAALPRPRGATRIGYFIVAGRDRTVEARFPGEGEVTIVVTDACEGESLPAAPRGPRRLGLAGDASRTTDLFDLRDLDAFVSNVQVETPPPSRLADATPMPVLLPAGTRVRMSTVSPQLLRGQTLRETAAFVTLLPEAGGEAVSVAKDGGRIEGRLVEVDADAYVLSVKGAGHVRVRHRDLRGLEMREPGKPGLGVIGGLAGIAGGMLMTGLVCVTIDYCTQEMLWAGTGLGLVAGASAGRGSWIPVPIPAGRRVSLALAPGKDGVALRVAVGF